MEFTDIITGLQYLAAAPLGAVVVYFLLRKKYGAQALKISAEATEIDLRGEMSLNDFLQKRVLELEKIRADQSDLIQSLREELAEERLARESAMRQLEEWKNKNGTAEKKIEALKKELNELKRSLIKQ